MFINNGDVLRDAVGGWDKSGARQIRISQERGGESTQR